MCNTLFPKWTPQNLMEYSMAVLISSFVHARPDQAHIGKAPPTDHHPLLHRAGGLQRASPAALYQAIPKVVAVPNRNVPKCVCLVFLPCTCSYVGSAPEARACRQQHSSNSAASSGRSRSAAERLQRCKISVHTHTFTARRAEKTACRRSQMAQCTSCRCWCIR